MFSPELGIRQLCEIRAARFFKSWPRYGINKKVVFFPLTKISGFHYHALWVYKSAYLQLRKAANDPVNNFIFQSTFTLADESDLKALMSNCKADALPSLKNIWEGGPGGPVIDPTDPTPNPNTPFVQQTVICGCETEREVHPFAMQPFPLPTNHFDNTIIKSLSYYIYDHLGNTRVTFDVAAGGIIPALTIAAMFDYDPYGKILRSFTLGEEKYLTTQHERDKETGLDYRGARFYDAEVGRFLSVDPMAMKYPGMSGYCYVGGMVTIAVDPDGRKIYYSEDARKNKALKSAVNLMLKSEIGRKEFLKVKRSNKVDAYIDVNDIGNAKGQTAKIKSGMYEDNPVIHASGVSLSKFDFSNGELEKNKVAMAEGRREGFLVTIDKNFLEDGNSKTWQHAETCFHEIALHINRRNAGDGVDQHLSGGLFQLGESTASPYLYMDGLMTDFLNEIGSEQNASVQREIQKEIMDRSVTEFLRRNRQQFIDSRK